MMVVQSIIHENPVLKVLDGIDALVEQDFDSIKINMVVQKGINEHEILPMVAYSVDHEQRFWLIVNT